MKKILIFYGSYGGGHLSAATAIASYFQEFYKDEIKIDTIDCIEYINKYVNKVSTEAYKELAKKAPWVWKQVYNKSKNGALSHLSTATNRVMSLKLNSLLQELKPDLIISTHPFATQMCAILRKRGKINCNIATVLTDYHIHPQWLVLYEYVDYFFVSNSTMKTDMINSGVDANKIFVTGIPVSKRFAGEFNDEEIYKEFELSPDKPVILFFAGGEFGLGRNTTTMVLKSLIRLFKELQVVAISGKNKKMNKRFLEIVEATHSEKRVKILEYTNKVPELMHISIGAITKPGGLTVSECLVSHLPIVIINPIPGQEEENAEFLVNNGVAIWIRKGESVVRTLKNISRDLDKLNNMKENTIKLAKPDATENICQVLVNEFNDIIKFPTKIIVSVLIKCKDKYLFLEENNNVANTYEKQTTLSIFESELENGEIIEEYIKEYVLKETAIPIESITPVDFYSNIDKYNGRKYQLIYLRYTAEIEDVSHFKSTSNNKNLVWISKNDLKSSNYTEHTHNLLNKLNLIK